MEKPTYELVETVSGGKTLKRTDTDGKIWWIPIDPANSDYQAYLESLDDNGEAE